MSEKIFLTEDMTCPVCERKLEKAISAVDGVSYVKASYAENRITVRFDKNCRQEDIISAIEGAGYSLGGGKTKKKIADAASLLIIIIALYVILKSLGLDSFYRYFPQAQRGMSFAALFIVGLLTSVHCVAMCGGINLSASIGTTGQKPALSAFVYNFGRVISYTVIGGILGGIGSAAAFSVKARAVIGIAAGIAMLIMGLNMLGCFGFLRKLSVRPPKVLVQKLFGGKKHGSFYIGLLNGLMPCGPLQSMQIFAVASGSFLYGALSMLFFSLGTIPLMLIFGTFAGALKKKFKDKMMTASAVLIFVFGLVMIMNNSALAGVNIPSTNSGTDSIAVSQMKDGVQYVTTTLKAGSYAPIQIKKGIPVEWTVIADEQSLNGCNNSLVISEYDLTVKLQKGSTVIKFTPEDTGTFGYSCWMGMIKSNIVVTD